VSESEEVKDEISAMASAYKALKGLDAAALQRAMAWLRDRLNAELSGDEDPF
jgi:hypothetical protein